jgi:hypothetical protein
MSFRRSSRLTLSTPPVRVFPVFRAGIAATSSASYPAMGHPATLTFRVSDGSTYRSLTRANPSEVGLRPAVPFTVDAVVLA